MPAAIDKTQSLSGHFQQLNSRLGMFALPAAPETFPDATDDDLELGLEPSIDVEAPIWWPQTQGRVRTADQSDLLLATDASCDPYPNGTASMVALSSRGDFELVTQPSDASIGNFEARGLVLALSIVADVAPPAAVILCDSRDALFLADVLKRGLKPQEHYRGMTQKSIKILGEALARVSCPVEFKWVKGHAGHPLNEAADQLASFGRLASKQPPAISEAALTSQIDDLVAGVQDLDAVELRQLPDALYGTVSDDGHLPDEPTPLTNSLSDAFEDLALVFPSGD